MVCIIMREEFLGSKCFHLALPGLIRSCVNNYIKMGIYSEGRKKMKSSWALVAYISNPTHSGGRNQEDHVPKPTQANGS
jgi:hypothetical protein